MAATTHNIWIKYIIILATIFRQLLQIPLILFSAGAKRIPLSLTGFIQYVGPTIMFILGIFVLKSHLILIN